LDVDCYTCKSTSGEKRISPGPTIYEGEYWLVEHAYPCGMTGWLVLVLKRHAEALHELTGAEFVELAKLQRCAATSLHRELGCEKEYVACFAEAAHFSHVHVHVVAKSKGLPEELRGPAIFRMLKVTEEEAVPRDTIREFCERLKRVFT
jgi:diadenosine tetraphosphate (Ap4A) HIT family hydrolase